MNIVCVSHRIDLLLRLCCVSHEIQKFFQCSTTVLPTLYMQY